MHRTARQLRRAAGALAVLVATSTLLLTPTTSAHAATGDISSEWPLNASHLQADRVWAVCKGAGVTVAVVDGGVDATHPDLLGQVLPGTSFLGDGADGRTDTSSDSHGTAIAALIAGTGASDHGHGIVGLAPAAKILPVRVTTGSEVTPPVLAQGITWAADHGAKIINVSMGEPDPDPLLKQAVAYAMSKDAVVVASAGNDGQSGDPVLYPAGFPGVVSVSGTDENHAFWTTSESGPDITVAAPASDIASASDTGQYVQADGTSYAAAYVSATLALIRSRYPDLTAGQAIQRLITTTRQHRATPGTQLGYGEIDPLSALTADVTTSSPANPLLAQHPAPTAGSGPDPAWICAAGILTAALIGLGGRVIARRMKHRGKGRPRAEQPAPAATARPRKPAQGKKKPHPKSPARAR